MTDYLTLDKEKCNACGLCVSVCARYGLALREGYVHIVESVECDWCRQCELVCPTGALAFSFEVVIEEGQSEA